MSEHVLSIQVGHGFDNTLYYDHHCWYLQKCPLRYPKDSHNGFISSTVLGAHQNMFDWLSPVFEVETECASSKQDLNRPPQPHMRPDPGCSAEAVSVYLRFSLRYSHSAQEPRPSVCAWSVTSEGPCTNFSIRTSTTSLPFCARTGMLANTATKFTARSRYGRWSSVKTCVLGSEPKTRVTML